MVNNWDKIKWVFYISNGSLKMLYVKIFLKVFVGKFIICKKRMFYFLNRMMND